MVTTASKGHGCNQALLERGNPTDSLSALTRLKRVEALSNRAVAIRILQSDYRCLLDQPTRLRPQVWSSVALERLLAVAPKRS